MLIPSQQIRRPWIILFALALLVSLRIAAPSDLYDNDQPGPVAHIVDVAVNNQWLMQQQPSGKLATKPPMYPWLGAIGVKLTGVTNEFMFKLPILLAFAMTTWVTFDLARRSLGAAGGYIAIGLWACNFHVFKLLYTARTDMLVTMWASIGLWCVVRLRETWQLEGAADRPARASVRWIALLWLSVAACALTKGPPAALPIVYLVLCITIDKAWRRCNPWLHLIGVVIATSVVLAWLLPALSAHPRWLINIRTEVSDRITGINAPATRDTRAIAMPGYFVVRFAPWSSLVIVTTVSILIARYQRARHPATWALIWTLMVIVIFMIPKGRRADYLAPAYPAAAVLAAWAIVEAMRSGGADAGARLLRMVVSITLVAALLVPVAVGMAQPWLGGGVIASAAAVAAIMTGCVGLWWLSRRQFDRCAAWACVSLACGMGIYRFTLSGPAEDVTSRELAVVLATARDESSRRGLPVACYEVGYTPVQALLGRNDPMDERALERVRGGAGGVVIVGKTAWDNTATDLAPRANFLHVTPKLAESHIELAVVAVEPK